MMKTPFVMAMLVLSLAGCQWEATELEPELAQDEFEIRWETIQDSDDLLVKRATLRFRGEKWLNVLEGKGGSSGSAIAPSRHIHGQATDEVGTVSVLFLVDQINVGPQGEQKRFYKSLIQIQSNGGGSGGSSVQEQRPDKTLSSMMQLNDTSGTFPIGQFINIGTSNGEPILLTITMPPPPQIVPALETPEPPIPDS